MKEHKWSPKIWITLREWLAIGEMEIDTYELSLQKDNYDQDGNLILEEEYIIHGFRLHDGNLVSEEIYEYYIFDIYINNLHFDKVKDNGNVYICLKKEIPKNLCKVCNANPCLYICEKDKNEFLKIKIMKERKEK